MHTRNTPGEDWSYAVTDQGIPRTQDRGLEEPLPLRLQGERVLWHLDLGLLDSRALRQ